MQGTEDFRYRTKVRDARRANRKSDDRNYNTELVQYCLRQFVARRILEREIGDEQHGAKQEYADERQLAISPIFPSRIEERYS